MRYWLLTFGIVLIWGCNRKSEVKPAKGYNVVLVIVDDLNDWVSPLGGHPQALTPNFSRLAEQSLTFTNAYCAAPVCNPSRVAMLTGIQPYNSGVYTNSDQFRESEKLQNALTLPQLFRQNGYTTLSTGKIFHEAEGLRADPLSWNILRPEEGDKLLNSATRTEHVLANGMEYINVYEKLTDWEEQSSTVEQSADFKNTAWAAEQIRTRKEPYFLACGIYKPHLPWYLPAGSFAKYNLDSLRLAPSFVVDLDDLPFETEAILRTSNPRSDYNRIANTNNHKAATRAYLAAISFADKCLGNILDAIEADGDSTILIVVGDHGWHLGEKKYYSKVTLWERSAHAPMFIRLPKGDQGGKRVSEIVGFIDLYPTIAKYCNIPLESEVDGEDVSYLFSNPESIRNRYVLTTLDSGNVTVRYKNWRYIRYAKGGEELYNHTSDPNEWYNLASNQNYATTIDSLKAMLPTKYQPSVSGIGHVVFKY